MVCCRSPQDHRYYRARVIEINSDQDITQVQYAKVSLLWGVIAFIWNLIQFRFLSVQHRLHFMKD